MKQSMVAALLCLFGAAAMAQTPAAPAAPARAPVSAAKKQLVDKVLQLQQPGINNMAAIIVQRPAAMMMQNVGNLLQARVPADRREAVAKDIQADIKKYMDETVPIVRDRAVKLAPTTIAPLLEERFTEDELKQLIAIIESPVNKKFLQMGAEMERALASKVVEDSKAAVDPKILALNQSVAARLGIKPGEAAAGSAAPAPAASVPK